MFWPQVRLQTDIASHNLNQGCSIHFHPLLLWHTVEMYIAFSGLRLESLVAAEFSSRSRTRSPLAFHIGIDAPLLPDSTSEHTPLRRYYRSCCSVQFHKRAWHIQVGPTRTAQRTNRMCNNQPPCPATSSLPLKLWRSKSAETPHMDSKNAEIFTGAS